MTYKDLLDFQDQHIVDELYQRIKGENNEELDHIYQDIKKRNQNTFQNTQYQYRTIKDKISQILEIIGMFLFAIVFIVTGSLVLAFFGVWIHVYVLKGANADLLNWMVHFGENVFYQLLSSFADTEVMMMLQADPSISLLFYVFGLTTLFVIIFTILYIVSMFKKKKQVIKETKKKEMTLEKSYRYLQVDQDDSFEYIRSNFKRKLMRKNKDFFNHYYDAYICLFQHYQEVEGSFSSLSLSQKIILCLRTLMNTLKNILGSLSKPIFFSASLLWFYYRMFCTTEVFTLEFLIKGSWFEKPIMSVMNTCQWIVLQTPMKSLLETMNLELAKAFSVAVVFSVIYFIYDVCQRKIRESKRQYMRRMNFYIKKNQGIYDQTKKLSSSYLYSLEFTIFVVIVFIVIIVIQFG